MCRCRARVLVALLLPLAATGCGKARAAPLPAGAASAGVADDLGSIPDAQVSGRVAGQPFALRTARYFIDRRPGRETVQIELMAGALEKPCESNSAVHDATLWLRETGASTIAPQTVRFGPLDKTQTWEGHYEVYGEGAWTGNGDATVLLVVEDVGSDLLLTGSISACFADAAHSCVAGRFAARYCPIRIDALVRGTDAMERPPPGRTRPRSEPNGADSADPQ